MEGPEGIGPIIDTALIDIGDGEIDHLEVVFNLVKGRFSDINDRPDFKTFIVLRHGEHVEIIHVIQQPRAGQYPLDGAGVQRARHAGGGGVQLSKTCSPQRSETGGFGDAVDFNVNNTVVKIRRRREVESDLGDVWSIFICIEGIQPGVMCGEGHGFFGKPSSV